MLNKGVKKRYLGYFTLLLFLSSSLANTVQGENSLYYSPFLKKDQRFSWHVTNTKYNLTTGEITEYKNYYWNITAIGTIGGVQATLLTNYDEDYFTMTENGSEVAFFDARFYWNIEQNEYPLIAPTSLNGTENYFEYLATDSVIASFVTTTKYQATIAYDSHQVFGSTQNNISSNFVYDKNSGVLISMRWDYNVSGPSDHYSEVNTRHLEMAPSFVVTDETDSGTSKSENSSTEAFLGGIQMQIIGLMTFISIVPLKRKYKTSRTN